ncbi:MAG: transposase [Chitinophagales bacterium]|nr:transposase [Chitinophagales bacterium]
MRKSFKYRIYLNSSQALACKNIFDSCLSLYNNALKERISSYNLYKKSISYFDQCKNLNSLLPHKLENVHSQVYQSTLKKVNSAFINFFNRLKNKAGAAGFPRFKSKLKSITFPQCNLKSGGVKLLPDNHLIITGLPDKVKMVLHRPFSGTCKTVQLIKTSTNKYYIVLSCDGIVKQPLIKTNKSVGLDVGIKSFVTLDDGTQYHHPKPYKTSKEKLQYLNRKIANAQKESKNKEKLRLEKAKLFEKNKNIIEDYQHKLSNKLLKEYDKIYIEKLNVKNMLESSDNSNLNKAIVECSWAAFAAKLIYKAENADKLVKQVEARNTSKTCSYCKNIKEKMELKERVYKCQACGLVLDRDINAARNIRALGTSVEINYVKTEAPPLMVG